MLLFYFVILFPKGARFLFYLEPLYQVYAADVLSEMRRKSEKGYKGDEDVFSEYSTDSIESGQRLLWCQLPSVRDSGVLQSLERREQKRQEVRV